MNALSPQQQQEIANALATQQQQQQQLTTLSPQQQQLSNTLSPQQQQHISPNQSYTQFIYSPPPVSDNSATPPNPAALMQQTQQPQHIAESSINLGIESKFIFLVYISKR